MEKEIKYVIHNGLIEVIRQAELEGWEYVVTLPATTIKEYAFNYERVTIFVRYKEESV